MNTSISCTKQILNRLNYYISEEKLYEEFHKHPDYPSLLAISDVLASLDVDNSAYRIESKDLLNIPTPFLAHINLDQDDFVVVNKIKNDYIYVSNEKWNNKKFTTLDFLACFTGVVLCVESKNASPSLSYYKAYFQDNQYSLLGILLFISLAFGFLVNPFWVILHDVRTSLLLFIKTLGIIVSVLLFIQGIDAQNPLIRRLCGISKKSDCNKILSSKAANAFWGFTWSDIGFLYFTVTWLLLFFFGSVNVINFLTIMTILSLPYSVYSIYYQARVARRWCILCCTVQAILWLEFFTLSNRLVEFTFPVYDLKFFFSALLISIILGFVLWKILKTILNQTYKIPVLRQQLHQTMFNPETFIQLSIRENQYPIPDDNNCIIIGNKNGKNVLTMVTDPYCPPCANIHRQLEDVLNINKDLRVQITFTGNNTKNDYQRPVTKHLMALNKMMSEAEIKETLKDWYLQKEKNYNTWKKKFPIEHDDSETYKLENQYNWYSTNNIQGTPTILLNGFELPQIYELGDLKYLLLII